MRALNTTGKAKPIPTWGARDRGCWGCCWGGTSRRRTSVMGVLCTSMLNVFCHFSEARNKIRRPSIAWAPHWKQAPGAMDLGNRYVQQSNICLIPILEQPDIENSPLGSTLLIPSAGHTGTLCYSDPWHLPRNFMSFCWDTLWSPQDPFIKELNDDIPHQ